MTLTRFFALFVLFLTVPLVPAGAHPHAWIDIATRVILDDRGHITAIEQGWLFDEIYSAFVVEDVEGQVTRAALNDLARNNLSNLHEHDYFTEIRLGGRKVALDRVRTWDSEMRGDRLWMGFTVPLAEPVDPGGGHVRYAVFDPSYWIEMAYGETDEAVIVAASGHDHGCFLMPELPVITGSMLALAFSLDRDDEAPTNLGAQFATWVEVLCP